MKISGIDIDDTLKRVRKELNEATEISPSFRSLIELLLLIVTILLQRLGYNSSNSSLPPSRDLFKKIESGKKPSGKKPGAQAGHIGQTLCRFENVDEVIFHRVDECKGCLRDLSQQRADMVETRQVIDMKISLEVIDHKAERKCCDCGHYNSASFPHGVTKAVQYGAGVQALSVYLSQYQLVPVKRIGEFFKDVVGLPLSAGTIVNFNHETANNLKDFENRLRTELIQSQLLHADETGIRVEKENAWIHVVSNDNWTYVFAHEDRSLEAARLMKVLPNFQGALVHDHWKPYLKMSRAKHVLCNAHHLRELKALIEFEHQKWAERMRDLLIEINVEKQRTRGGVAKVKQIRFRKRYRTILTRAEKEFLPGQKVPGQKGRVKNSTAFNLIRRLREFEEETLRFMVEPSVPFTNNQAERDLRMSKVQQKISGCFRSMTGAETFCRVRSFCSSAKKQNHSAYKVLLSLTQQNKWNFAE